MRSRRGCSRGSFGRSGAGGPVAGWAAVRRGSRSRLCVGCPDCRDLASGTPPAGQRRQPGAGAWSTIAAMSLLDDYLARTPRSRELFERATGSLPGGSTRTTVYTAPYPPYIESGSGLWLRDVDGNRYRDFLCNFRALCLAHPRPAVVDAAEHKVRRGSPFAAPTETNVLLSEDIRARVPSVER